MSEPIDTTDMRRAARAVYLATDVPVADELSRMLASAAIELDQLRTELATVRKALTEWDFAGDGNRSRTESAMEHRDRVVNYLLAEFDPERPYVAVDHVIGMLHERWEGVDHTLYDVIPDDHWGLR